MHEVADDLRCLITSSVSYHRDIFHAKKLVEQTIPPSTGIPYSHEKLVTMLNQVEGIKCNVLSELLISSLYFSFNNVKLGIIK